MFKVTTMDFPDDIENPQVETRGEFKDYDAAVAARASHRRLLHHHRK